MSSRKLIKNLEEELRTYQHLFVYFELWMASHKVSKNVIENFNKSLVDKKAWSLFQEYKVRSEKESSFLVQNFVNKPDFIKSCSRGRINTECRFNHFTILKGFAVLHKNVPQGSKEAVLLEILLKNCAINCLTFQENKRQLNDSNLCCFCSLALHLHDNQKLEEKIPKCFNSILKESDGVGPS